MGAHLFTRNYYNIADMKILVKQDSKYELERFSYFKDNCIKNIFVKPDISFSMKGMQKIEIDNAKFILKEDIQWLKLDSGGVGLAFTDSNGNVISYMKANNNWSDNELLYRGKCDLGGYTFEEHLVGLAFRNMIIRMNGIIIHSSAVIVEGKGIIFSAPSGTGKSTHTRLWEKNFGAVVINDDTPALRVVNNKAFVYGTPWSGSTSKFVNTKAPLSAIVMLSQAKENEVVRLGAVDAVKTILPRSFLPYQDSKLMDMAMKVIENIISLVPVYHLKCRPDLEAAELMKKCLIG